MIIRLHPETPQKRHIKQIVDILNKGGLIVYPTDTVYAFGALARQKKAIEKINFLKRDKKKNRLFTIMCSDISQLATMTLPIPNNIFKILKKNTPGPFTFIFKANSQLPKLIYSKRQTVGVRIPDSTLIQALLEELDDILVSTSVDKEDEIDPFFFTQDELIDIFENQVDVIILSEQPPFKLSTVIDATEDTIEIIRDGEHQLKV